MGSASPLVAFVFVLCFHFPVYSCNKRTIVLRGPTIYRDGHCPGCRNDQGDTGASGEVPVPPVTPGGSNSTTSPATDKNDTLSTVDSTPTKGELRSTEGLPSPLVFNLTDFQGDSVDKIDTVPPAEKTTSTHQPPLIWNLNLTHGDHVEKNATVPPAEKTTSTYSSPLVFNLTDPQGDSVDKNATMPPGSNQTPPPPLVFNLTTSHHGDSVDTNVTIPQVDKTSSSPLVFNLTSLPENHTTEHPFTNITESNDGFEKHKVDPALDLEEVHLGGDFHKNFLETKVDTLNNDDEDYGESEFYKDDLKNYGVNVDMFESEEKNDFLLPQRVKSASEESFDKQMESLKSLKSHTDLSGGGRHKRSPYELDGGQPLTVAGQGIEPPENQSPVMRDFRNMLKEDAGQVDNKTMAKGSSDRPQHLPWSGSAPLTGPGAPGHNHTDELQDLQSTLRPMKHEHIEHKETSPSSSSPSSSSPSSSSPSSSSPSSSSPASSRPTKPSTTPVSPLPIDSKINASIPLKEHVVNSHETNCSKKVDKGGHIEQHCVHKWHKGDPDTPVPPSGDHPIPMGDCRCGKRPKLERYGDAKELNRPWMVHFRIRLASMRYIECSGSLINRRWIVSAAHCFCPLAKTQSNDCRLYNIGFNKVIPSEDGDISEANENVNMTFGSTAETRTWASDRGIKLARVVLHPDYWEDVKKHGNPYDLALIKTDKDIYEGDGTDLIAPICLPPRGPVLLNMLEVAANSAVKPRYEPAWYTRKKTPLVPFEDMDCFTNSLPWIEGTRHDTEIQRGYLKCHPGKVKDGHINTEVNVQSTTSYITGFGLLASPLNMDGSYPYTSKRECRTNEFSPNGNIHKRCIHDKCERHKPNPSLSYKVCTENEFSNNTGRSEIVVRHYMPDNPNPAQYHCYPWSPEELIEDDKYKGGWCNTKAEGQPENWGWCVPGCDGELDRRTLEEDRQRLHELPVDSFVYENCSRNVDTFTEFCSGYATLTGDRKIYDLTDNKLKFVRNEGRKYLFSKEEHPMHIRDDYDDVPASQHMMNPAEHLFINTRHTNIQGDACYGDAGGAVWKYWRFSRTDSDSEQLAVLTGVISRYEESCGTFYTGSHPHDIPANPTQHTVHSRVLAHLDWIMRETFKEPVCGGSGASGDSNEDK